MTGKPVAGAGMDAALDQILAGIDRLVEAGFDPVDNRDALACVRKFELVRRRADSAAMSLVASIERRGMFRDDGFGSAKSMVRHAAKLSTGEAGARSRVAKMLASLPAVAAAFESGEFGSEQIRLLGRVHANPRVRDLMADDDQWFVAQARRNTYVDFKRVVAKWEELKDEDGPNPNDRAHQNRNAQLIQEFNKSWDLQGRFPALQGAAMHEIFGYYIDAELKADWEKARAEYGDAACTDDLWRTDPQRRADALWRMFQDAAASPHGAVPPGFQHNIVWNQATHEYELAKLAGGNPAPLHPDNYRCETINGQPLDGAEAIVNSLISRVRRVVVNARSTVIDLGEARFFTGNVRHAVNLASTSCVWPGCMVPSTSCEADHLVEHCRGGRTNPDNGAPLCGKHNRWKQKGFSINRDAAGNWHTRRPDGTELE